MKSARGLLVVAGLVVALLLLLLAACTQDEPAAQSSAAPIATAVDVLPTPSPVPAVAEATPVPEPTATPTAEPVAASVFITAKPEAGSFHTGAGGHVVPVYDEPGGEPRMLVYSNVYDGDVRYPLRNPRKSGEPLVLRVLEGSADDEWVNVQAPVRPTRSSVWVRAADFDFDTSALRIEVDIAGPGRFSLFDGTDEIITNQIVSGRDSRPTTLADTYVDQVIDTSTYRFSSPAYGPYVITWATFSDVLSSFGQGRLPSQGVHGTNQPELMGQQVSSGKIRLPNEIVTFVAEYSDAEYSDSLVGASVVVFDSSGIGRDVAIERLQDQPWTPAVTADPNSSLLKIGQPLF